MANYDSAYRGPHEDRITRAGYGRDPASDQGEAYTDRRTPLGGTAMASASRPVSSQLPVPPSGGSTTSYYHRAVKISTGLFVYWWWSAADPTGAHSGYTPAELSDVVVVRKVVS